MAQILLTTLNARYMHTAFGLRYLYANLGDLKSKTRIIEFTIHERPIDIAEKLLQNQPQIIGFSIYIWNVKETTQTIALIREIAPDVTVIVGGPEVSHPPDLPSVCDLVNYVVTGPGEITLPHLCAQILRGKKTTGKVLHGEIVSLDQLEMPYQFYTDEDIRNRLIYVEASRGCPFKCEFCLSSLDKTAKPFELEKFLKEMDKLYQRGARNFKFIDRTFNLKIDNSIRILEFFLDRMSDDLYLHFEVVPDNLPDRLKETIRKFPPNSLQFEIGIQTFDQQIQSRISRRQNNEKTCENLKWLKENTSVHIHADLIFGLPGDSLENFASSFDQLITLHPQEIQVGILKRLRGAPINRHIKDYQLRFNPEAPYNLLSSHEIDFMTMQRMNRFARFWDMIANSGRFLNTVPVILGDDPFFRFLRLSDILYEKAGSTWKIALKRLFGTLFEIMTENLCIPVTDARRVLDKDYRRSGQKGQPMFIKPLLKSVPGKGAANKRQQKHYQ